MTDQLKLLPPFTWRGERYPVVRRNLSFAHESVQHKRQRRNGDLIEQTGAHSPVITYEIPVVEGLLPALEYSGLFTERLQRLLNDIRNRARGDLFDPVYGQLICVPSSYNDDLDATVRSGTNIRLEFRHDPDDEDDEIVVTPTVAAQEAGALHVDATTFQVEAEETEEISPNDSIELTKLMGQLASTGRQILNLPNDARSEITKVIFYAKEIEDIVYEATSPQAIIARHQARETRDKAERALENALLVRPVRTRIVAKPQSLVSIAADLGVPFEAFLAANRALARSPTVPVGATIVIPDAN